MDNAVGHPRLGLVVPRYQQTAVARNRLRRRLRELWRREVQPDQPARDLVIRARRELPGHLSRARLLHLEIPFGYFERRVTLPPGHYRVLESVLADGLLRLRLQKEDGR